MMMNKKYVIDTNVLVSALLVKNSRPFQLIQKIEQEGIILYSEATISELNQVLNRQKFDKYVTKQEREEFLVKLINKSEQITIIENINICRDAKDNKFLELAVSGEADFIITGDNDLLVLNPFRAIEIITVTEFLTRFSSDFLR